MTKIITLALGIALVSPFVGCTRNNETETGTRTHDNQTGSPTTNQGATTDSTGRPTGTLGQPGAGGEMQVPPGSAPGTSPNGQPNQTGGAGSPGSH